MPTPRHPLKSIWPWLCCALPALALAHGQAPTPWAPGAPIQIADRGHRDEHGERHQREDRHERRYRDERPLVVAPMAGGIVFSPMQQHAARSYYLEDEHRGFVPPGLAKKGGIPPGQLKRWRVGYPLPVGVPYYALPGTLMLQLGPPPAGYRYVRVASDILLIAIGTSMVVDAIQDIVR